MDVCLLFLCSFIQVFPLIGRPSVSVQFSFTVCVITVVIISSVNERAMGHLAYLSEPHTFFHAAAPPRPDGELILQHYSLPWSQESRCGLYVDVDRRDFHFPFLFSDTNMSARSLRHDEYWSGMLIMRSNVSFWSLSRLQVFWWNLLFY